MTNENANANEIKGFRSIDDIPGRQVFAAGPNATVAALEYMQRVLSTPGVNESLPTAIHGLTPDGAIDWSRYEGRDIYVILLRNKGKGYRCLSLQPAPTMDSFLTDDSARPWIKSVLETEIAHKMVRTLRAPKGDITAPITESDIAQIPLTIADYIASHRLGGAVALWNANAKRMIDTVAASVPAFAAQRFTKDLLRKAIESKPFALAVYPHLEQAASGSLFVRIANSLITFGRKEGSDTSLIESWLAGRDNVAVEDAGSEGLDDFDADSIFDAEGEGEAASAAA